MQSSDEGNFIAGDGWIDASKLFKDGKRTITLYVEAVKSDAGAKETKVSMKTTGAADADATSDTVKLTVQKFTYTADEIEKALAADPGYGKKVGFLIQTPKDWGTLIIKIDTGRGTLNVNLFKGVTIGDAAISLEQAKQCAIDALRAWASKSLSFFPGANYTFLGIAREWASNGMDYGATVKNGEDAAQSLGSTLDFLYFFSDQNGTESVGYKSNDVPYLLCWIYTGIGNITKNQILQKSVLLLHLKKGLFQLRRS